MQRFKSHKKNSWLVNRCLDLCELALRFLMAMGAVEEFLIIPKGFKYRWEWSGDESRLIIEKGREADSG